MEFDPTIRYQCLQCGKSCRQDWDIWVRPDFPAMVRQDYLEIFSGPAFPFEAVDGRWRMSRGSSGCASLDSQSLCKIHSSLSYEEKPYRCQQYPILLIETPDGVRASASYTCTAVLESHGPELEVLASKMAIWLDRPFSVTKVGEGLAWDEAMAQEAHFVELLQASGWEVALRRILSGLVSGHQDLRSDHPLSWWKHYRCLPLDLNSCLPWLLAALLKPCLQLKSKAEWSLFDQAMLEQGALCLDEFSYRGSVSELLSWAAAEERSFPDLERYRGSLLFRKQQLRCGGILSGWLMLWSVGPVYRVLHELCGSHGALERIEMNLLGHTSLAEQVFPALAQFWLDEQLVPVA